MFRVTGSDGRKIGAYRFGDPKKARFSKLRGRTAFATQLKAKLIALHGSRCAIYLEEFEERLLQIDQQVPMRDERIEPALDGRVPPGMTGGGE